jgi:catechol 2,3-dioxygenase-like lactoylglutathione lyase family enzyme
MLDHITITVADMGRAMAFYDAVLATLGIERMMSGEGFAGYGADGRPFFWLGGGWGNAGYAHVAFTTKDRETVDAFYAAAMAAGGRDNGPPGVRAHYHPTYYGAFVLDPDGHNIEAVCHTPG